MKYLDGNYYVEVKDHRYGIHPTEKRILRKRDPPTSLRTQYQVQNKTQIRGNRKVIKNDNDELIVKNYPKNKQLPDCPDCKRSNWLKFDDGYYCCKCEYIINKEKHEIDKKNVLRQFHDFSTSLNYAKKKLRKIWMNTVNTTYNSLQDMINKLQQLKGKTKLKFFQKKSNYYNEMKEKKFQTQQDPFSKNAQSIGKIYHEVSI